MLNEDQIHRMAVGIVESQSVDYDLAIEKMNKMQLYVIVHDSIERSIALQAALLTVVNTAMRVFLGGIKIKMSRNIRSRIPWPGMSTLDMIVEELGASIVDEDIPDFHLSIGGPGLTDDALELICNGWVGGFLTNNQTNLLPKAPDFPIGGVVAASLAIQASFLKMSGIKPDAADHTQGLSLWRPDLSWLDHEAVGPEVTCFPSNLWVAGLGHLGQAYIWTMSLFNFSATDDYSFLLQDYDSIEEANLGSGLISFPFSLGKKKTRNASDWLEKRGFKTRILESRFTENTYRDQIDPSVLLCGFDNASARRAIKRDDFDLIIDCGLGGRINSFDSTTVHVFPNYQKEPGEIWKEDKPLTQKNMTKIRNELFGCGAFSKAISSSFVGAFSSAIVISELLKALHFGTAISKSVISMRNIESRRFVFGHQYSTELGSNGYARLG